MRHWVEPRQQIFFDPFAGIISPAGWNRIADGWQGVFRELVLEQLPIERLGRLRVRGSPAVTKSSG